MSTGKNTEACKALEELLRELKRVGEQGSVSFKKERNRLRFFIDNKHSIHDDYSYEAARFCGVEYEEGEKEPKEPITELWYYEPFVPLASLTIRPPRKEEFEIYSVIDDGNDAYALFEKAFSDFFILLDACSCAFEFMRNFDGSELDVLRDASEINNDKKKLQYAIRLHRFTERAEGLSKICDVILNYNAITQSKIDIISTLYYDYRVCGKTRDESCVYHDFGTGYYKDKYYTYANQKRDSRYSSSDARRTLFKTACAREKKLKLRFGGAIGIVGALIGLVGGNFVTSVVGTSANGGWILLAVSASLAIGGFILGRCIGYKVHYRTWNDHPTAAAIKAYKQFVEDEMSDISKHKNDMRDYLEQHNLLHDEIAFSSVKVKANEAKDILERIVSVCDDVLHSSLSIPKKYLHDTEMLSILLELIEEGRADSIKEAINIYVQEKRDVEYKTIRLQQANQQTQAQLATAAAIAQGVLV